MRWPGSTAASATAISDGVVRGKPSVVSSSDLEGGFGGGQGQQEMKIPVVYERDRGRREPSVEVFVKKTERL